VELILVMVGIGYSVLLLLVGSRVVENILYPPTIKFWLIVLMVLLPIIGLMIVYAKTNNPTQSNSANGNTDNSLVLVDTTSSSGDCGGGGE
jgi:phosphoglycerol transferase MdoB-like AlkP superfamily enzyme